MNSSLRPGINSPKRRQLIAREHLKDWNSWRKFELGPLGQWCREESWKTNDGQVQSGRRRGKADVSHWEMEVCGCRFCRPSLGVQEILNDKSMQWDWWPENEAAPASSRLRASWERVDDDNNLDMYCATEVSTSFIGTSSFCPGRILEAWRTDWASKRMSGPISRDRILDRMRWRWPI